MNSEEDERGSGEHQKRRSRPARRCNVGSWSSARAAKITAARKGQMSAPLRAQCLDRGPGASRSRLTPVASRASGVSSTLSISRGRCFCNETSRAQQDAKHPQRLLPVGDRSPSGGDALQEMAHSIRSGSLIRNGSARTALSHWRCFSSTSSPSFQAKAQTHRT